MLSNQLASISPVPVFKRIAGLWLLLFTALNGPGQNLLPNPSFESFTKCPSHTNFMDDEDFLNYAAPWRSACLTPDLFTPCAYGAPVTDVPENFTGYQTPKHGNNYAGLFICNKERCSGEYIYMRLEDTLKRGHKYTVSMWLSLADESDICHNQLAIHFSEENISPYQHNDNCNQVLEYDPQVLLAGNTPWLDDKDGWMFVKDSFVAEGGERFMTLGNFKNNQDFKTKKVGGLRNNTSYYYVDYARFIDKGKDPRYRPVLFLPNAFTPNGDGLNDRFRVVTDIELSNYKLQVYNRWGEVVYESNRQQQGWDGTYKGKRLPQGTYVWQLSYQGVLNQTYRKEGYVVLFR